jgi:hypothetical protein
MLKRTILFFLFTSSFIISFCQVKSPGDFLGYKIGSQLTPHWKVISYFQYIAANSTANVKLQQYGATNEGRQLVVAFVSSAENIQNLESIRKNNLRLANISMDKVAASENAPAIVWLSYNVHGNEASSTEAAMMVLYSLLDPSNTQVKEWLKNTVVVIDPCLNPDGRDRHVNWLNSIVSKNPDPLLQSREHDEPWPGGRTNHYNFDLNRDWAWQTQLESRQRMQLYNQWLPQVHVDYHEMGINEPYYFAPAAQPYHEVITKWQKDFQEIIGRNHAKYFDQNGWLYFTREEYDLYYPSYGDTYPIFNGAIGMTYEQAGGGGGGRAGLSVITASGDTLTLLDRITHHYTTSMSTIEVASQQASRLLKEFHQFFNDAVNKGVGDYRSYIIKYSEEDEQKIQSLLELLRKNGITYSAAKQGSGNGFNYNSRRDESFSIGANDILVSSLQPKSTLVKVLFEPSSKIIDSVTYDITAWSLPYVYGLNAFASKQNIASNGTWNPVFKALNNSASNYGYVLEWKGMQSARTAAQLMKQGVKLRYSEEPFDLNGHHFNRGAILILKTSNNFSNSLGNMVRAIADANNVQVYPISTGFVDKGSDLGSSKVHFIKTPKVAMLTGNEAYSNAAGEIWYLFDQELDYPITLINSNSFSVNNLNSFDILILPAGNFSFLNDKASAEQFRNWISAGGRVIALEDAVGQLSKLDWAIKSKKPEDNIKSDTAYGLLKIYEERERGSVSDITAGSIYKVQLDNTHPLAFGYPNYYYTLKKDDNIYEFLKDGWNVGVIKKDEPVAGFVGYKLKARLKDGLLFGTQNLGNGSITYFTDDVLFRDFWQNGKLMFCNAVFLLGQ